MSVAAGRRKGRRTRHAVPRLANCASLLQFTCPETPHPLPVVNGAWRGRPIHPAAGLGLGGPPVHLPWNGEWGRAPAWPPTSDIAPVTAFQAPTRRLRNRGPSKDAGYGFPARSCRVRGPRFCPSSPHMTISTTALSSFLAGSRQRGLAPGWRASSKPSAIWLMAPHPSEDRPISYRHHLRTPRRQKLPARLSSLHQRLEKSINPAPRPQSTMSISCLQAEGPSKTAGPMRVRGPTRLPPGHKSFE